jgi:hypothetical protein
MRMKEQKNVDGGDGKTGRKVEMMMIHGDGAY